MPDVGHPPPFHNPQLGWNAAYYPTYEEPPKKLCVLCGGTGTVRISGGLFSADQFCWTCNGTGEADG